MYIANPIYDVVFKYLMSDNKIAKQLISAIIKEEILEIDFAPQEYITKQIKDSPPNYTVCRMDFTAKIKTPEGLKMVVIEVQKALYTEDIIRFRRYLGSQFQNPNLVYIEEDENSEKRHAMPIYCIFFLGTDLGAEGVPVMKVHYEITDVATDEVLKVNHEFIRTLHHQSWIVQVPKIPEHRRNDLEILLSIFDQSKRTSDRHTLNVKEEDFQPKYRSIIRRLFHAAQNDEVKETMLLEDDYLSTLQMHERNNAKKDKVIEKQAKALEEKEKTLEEKDKVLEEKDKEIAELKRQLGKI